jgi:hypothetical protein
MRDQYSNLATKFEFLLSELLQIESQQLFLLNTQGPYINEDMRNQGILVYWR